jgi:hypothetical protein
MEIKDVLRRMSFRREYFVCELIQLNQNYVRLLDILRKSEYLETSVDTIRNINKNKSRYKDGGLLEEWNQSSESLLLKV